MQELARLSGLPGDSLPAAAAATHLLCFYGAIERALERIAQEFDGGAPSGGDWHRELLCMLARAVPKVRPSVLSPKSVE
ncbi:ribonuclease toxin HepT-like protein [Geochorda subterranea]|uniref:ribonuclease toxin HepT-like protein n=1 Tax=Geochorda subterranea TaxID=3109564 RepID=UPI00386021FA